jgi:hypothetical protein
MQHATLLGTAAATALLGAAPAFAQVNRTFVSGHGSDASPCSLAAPCRSFAGALAQTNPAGEIVVLDSAGYGAVTIDRAVSIINQDGVEAGITVTSGDAITVAAGFTDIVNLRGLSLYGGGAGSNGITYASAAAVYVDHCTIRGFTQNGINVTAGLAENLIVTDTTVADNGSGISMTPPAGGGTYRAMLARVHATGNANAGVIFNPGSGSSITAAIGDSLVDLNNIAISVGPGSTVMVDNSKLALNQTALFLSGGTFFELGRSVVFGNSVFHTGNTTGFFSFGNNQIDFNPQINPADHNGTAPLQ